MEAPVDAASLRSFFFSALAMLLRGTEARGRTLRDSKSSRTFPMRAQGGAESAHGEDPQRSAQRAERVKKVTSELLPSAWIDFRGSGRASAWNGIYTRGGSAASSCAGVAIWATLLSSPQPSRSCAALAPERRQRQGD